MTKHLLTDILQESIPDLINSHLRPVKVAVLDTGIDATHETLRHKVIGAWEYLEESQGPENMVNISEKELCCLKNNDSSFHGTAVASIISRIATNARFLDYKTLGPECVSTSLPMIAGLKAAIDGDAKIINISHVCLAQYRHDLEMLCELAYQKHKIVIAAKRNVPQPNGDLGFPAELATCISVDNINYDNNPFRVEHIDEQPIEFAAHGESVLVAQSGGGYRRISGTSFATPTVTAFVALLLGRYPDLELFEIKSILKYHSQNGTFRQLNTINPLEISEHTAKRNSYASTQYICPKCGYANCGYDEFSYMKCSACNHVFLFQSFTKLSNTVIRELTEKVLKDCLYHNVQHTQDVISNIHAFIKKYPKLTASQRKCLLAAALLHDYGFIKSYANNEPIAAQHAANLLPQYGFDAQEIELVKSLILATKMPVAPKTLLEKILCDADVGHIGTEQQLEKANLLRMEREAHGIQLTDKEWLQSEIAFLSHHHFFQKWLETERQKKKRQFLEILSKALKKNESCN